MPRILRTPQADHDLFGILLERAAYSQQSSDRLAAEIQKKAELYAQLPLAGAPIDELGANLRFFVVRPFVIFYRPLEDGMEIIRVVHGARDLPSLFGTG